MRISDSLKNVKGFFTQNTYKMFPSEGQALKAHEMSGKFLMQNINETFCNEDLQVTSEKKLIS